MGINTLTNQTQQAHRFQKLTIWKLAIPQLVKVIILLSYYQPTQSSTMSYSGSSEYIGLTRVKDPNEIGVKITWNRDITPSKFKDFLICALNPTVDSKDLLQRKSIPESVFAKLLDPTLVPLGGTEETKDDAVDSEDETKKDDDKSDPPNPKKKEKEVIKFFVKKDFIPT